jgi:hypothetical protein
MSEELREAREAIERLSDDLDTQYELNARHLAERDALVHAIDQEMVACELGTFSAGDDPKAALHALSLWWQQVGGMHADKEREQLRADLAALVPLALVGVEKLDDWQDVRESQGFTRQADDDETAAARAVLARYAEVPRG